MAEEVTGDPEVGRDEAFERRLHASMMIALDLTAAEALALGEQVPAKHVDPRYHGPLEIEGEWVTMTDAMARRVSLVVLPTQEEYEAAQYDAKFHSNGSTPDHELPDSPPSPQLRFYSGREFRKQHLASISPLLGDASDALMMPGSLMLLAGIGGSGKTTLALHWMAHVAAGLPWFGIQTARPLKVVVIENEGPHDPFAAKVDNFCERFQGCTCSGEAHGSAEGLDENVWFLDAPWGKFSFDDPGCARELNAFVKEVEADVVVANPLGRLGMKGAGAPEETREFLALLTEAGLNEDFAALLLHHLAKVARGTPLVQQISGDWGPHPDTILVMEQAGERTSRLSFGKVRWGDQGRSPLVLKWLTDEDGPVGYTVLEGAKSVSDDTLYERLHEFLAAQAEPLSITKITAGVHGQKERVRNMVKQGVDLGRIKSSGGSRPVFWLPEHQVPEQEGLL